MISTWFGVEMDSVVALALNLGLDSGYVARAFPKSLVVPRMSLLVLYQYQYTIFDPWAFVDYERPHR